MLVIRPFITLPARHSAVWVNAIFRDSHNYPEIERGTEISLAIALWVRQSLGKYAEKGDFCAFLTSLCRMCLNSVNM